LVQKVRVRSIYALASLPFVLVALSCSGAGGAPEPAGDTSSAAQQVATPAPAEVPAEQQAPATEQDDAMPASEAPEMRPENAAGAVQGVPAPTNTVPLVAVANYFTELPGIDVAGLKRGPREKFLQRVNSEMCSCGCKNDTLARCYVNDPRCPSVKTMVQKVYDEVKSGK
jgi:hypothetical protein